MKKKATSELPKMQYYFNKKKSKQEFICIIDNSFMLIFCVKKQEVQVSFSFDKNRIKQIKSYRYKKVSLEKGIEYAVNVGSKIEVIMNEKIMRGLEILWKETAVIISTNLSKRQIQERKNCCHGG